MDAQDKHDISKIIKDNFPLSGIRFGQVMQGVIAAGVIGLFVQFQEVRDNVTISKAERRALKDDIDELKSEVRQLRYRLYGNRYGEESQTGQ